MILYRFFVKTIKLSTGLGMLALMVSGDVERPENIEEMVLEGRYVFKATGDFNTHLKGYISFESSKEKSARGMDFSTLRLNLKNDTKSPDHSFEFLISKQNQDKVIRVGSYTVTKEIDGFLNYFDGVFGFANIGDLGEAPLFARNGKITIHHFDNKGISGMLSINLQSSSGKKIFITGSFMATQIR